MNTERLFTVARAMHGELLARLQPGEDGWGSVNDFTKIVVEVEESDGDMLSLADEVIKGQNLLSKAEDRIHNLKSLLKEQIEDNKRMEKQLVEISDAFKVLEGKVRDDRLFRLVCSVASSMPTNSRHHSMDIYTTAVMKMANALLKKVEAEEDADS